MTKKELREFYIDKRKKLLPNEVDFLNNRVAEKFNDLNLESVKIVHIFYPISGKREVDSLVLKEGITKRNPDVKYVLPKVNHDTGLLSNILWEQDTPLSVNRWGIVEPEYGFDIPINTIDLIIIPLLAFDKQGNRLGYGKGFYDRFLSQCRPDTLKVGVSYFEPEDSIETDNFDIPLDMCITPEKVWKF